MLCHYHPRARHFKQRTPHNNLWGWAYLLIADHRIEMHLTVRRYLLLGTGMLPVELQAHVPNTVQVRHTTM